MNLTSSEALAMIKEFEKVEENKHWISHSIYVGNSAEVIVRSLKEKGFDE